MPNRFQREEGKEEVYNKIWVIYKFDSRTRNRTVVDESTYCVMQKETWRFIGVHVFMCMREYSCKCPKVSGIFLCILRHIK